MENVALQHNQHEYGGVKVSALKNAQWCDNGSDSPSILLQLAHKTQTNCDDTRLT